MPQTDPQSTTDTPQTPGLPDIPAGQITILAGPESEGLRVDRFLADAIGTMSRSRVKSLIDEGRVRRGDHVMREPAEPVRAGAVYRLDPPTPVAAQPEAQAIDFPILYEDSDLIVLD